MVYNHKLQFSVRTSEVLDPEFQLTVNISLNKSLSVFTNSIYLKLLTPVQLILYT
jgi:hypothetical protein